MKSRRVITRRDLLKVSSITAGAWILSPVLQTVSFASLNTQKPTFRFAVASDLHFGHSTLPFLNYIELLVLRLNEEKEKRLDAVVLNGDITHDSTTAPKALQTNLLSKLATPYYAVKGNHDFVSEQESWEKAWGYPRNHVVVKDDLAFILADTTVSRQSKQYLPADVLWLKQQLSALKSMKMVFVFMHIAQRKHGVQGWPMGGLGRYKGQDTEAGEAVMALLELYDNVKAVFHGHNHNATGVYISGGKPYCFDSHVGGWFGNAVGYRVVEVYPNDTIATYQYAMENRSILNQHTF
ncbi:MAG: hypothetical protein GQ559_10515 [Desulfobulbaceae bacterium]|nr:hypothetical protein [Desulfobulbaceae bacterium]